MVGCRLFFIIVMPYTFIWGSKCIGFFEVNWMSSVLSFPDFKSIGKMPCLRPFSLVSFETLEHRGGDFC